MGEVMVKSKAKKIYFLPCESHYSSGKYTKITQDMMDTKAWAELTISQRGLYLILKAKVTRYRDGTYNIDDISMPKSEWIKYYTRKSTFDKDMDNLINLGFIKVILYQGNLRKPTIYGISEQWKYYKTSEFNVTDKDRRPKNIISKEHKKAISEGSKKSLAKLNAVKD
jgi:hypothetical protein